MKFWSNNSLAIDHNSLFAESGSKKSEEADKGYKASLIVHFTLYFKARILYKRHAAVSIHNALNMFVQHGALTLAKIYCCKSFTQSEHNASAERYIDSKP